MEGCKVRQGFFLIALTASGLLLVATPAQSGTVEAADGSRARVNGQEIWSALQQSWEGVREDLTRCALESVMTAFFIRGGAPPKTPPNVPPTQSPPKQEEAPPPPPPPPPPTGQGEVPPDVPPPPPPPQGAPEPASLVTALLGVGLTSWYAWRRRRRVEAV